MDQLVLTPTARWIDDIIVEPDGCWSHRRVPSPDGYRRYTNRTFSGLAHRMMYLLLRGQIPKGLQIDHLCRNRGCLNPWHMEPVTQLENIRRGVSMSQRNRLKTHCKHGHPFSPENTRINKYGRRCKTCHRERMRKYARRVA